MCCAVCACFLPLLAPRLIACANCACRGDSLQPVVLSMLSHVPSIRLFNYAVAFCVIMHLLLSKETHYIAIISPPAPPASPCLPLSPAYFPDTLGSRSCVSARATSQLGNKDADIVCSGRGLIAHLPTLTPHTA